MKILVTGSSGAIGGPLCVRLFSKGFEVIQVDLRSEDSRDIFNLSDSLEVDGIIHLAAISRVHDCEKNPDECLRVNIEGTRKIVDFVNYLKDRPWLIFASSREVYGDGHDGPVTESQPFEPLNLYGKIRVESELLIKKYLNPQNQRITLRFANIYGSPTDIESRFLPSLLRSIIHSEPFQLFGGERSFDFMHIDDVIDSILKSIFHIEIG